MTLNAQPLTKSFEVVLTHLQFSIIKDRLHQVSHDAQNGFENTQLKSRWATVFQLDPNNAMFFCLVGGRRNDVDNGLILLSWHPGIRRWCLSCLKCQLVNPPDMLRTPLRLLFLMKKPFKLKRNEFNWATALEYT